MAQITVDALNPIPSDFVVDKVILLVEGIDGEDGETTVWWTTSPGVKAWQTLGMLEAAVTIEKAWLAESYREHGPDE